MDLRQLRYFVVVAEELNIGRAAVRLHIVQPALSRQMKVLESELDVMLLDRLPRGVRLTTAGERLLEDARRILDDVDSATDRVRRVARGELGELTIGFVDTMSWTGIIPATLRAMQNQHPGIALRLVDMSSIKQQTAIREGRLDAGFAFYRDHEDGEVDGMTILKDEIMLAVATDSPLAAKASVKLADLVEESFIGFPRDAAPRFYTDLEAACNRGGLHQKVAHEGTTSISILGLVGAGLGVAFQPRSTEHRKPDSVTLLPIDDLRLTVPMDLAWRADNTSPALAILIGLVRQLLSEPRIQVGASGL